MDAEIIKVLQELNEYSIDSQLVIFDRAIDAINDLTKERDILAEALTYNESALNEWTYKGLELYHSITITETGERLRLVYELDVRNLLYAIAEHKLTEED